MKFIYRIEHPESKKGPYTHSWCDTWRCRPHNTKAHPTPYEEQLDFSEHFKCGFESLEKLSSWFNDQELDALEKLGFELIVIPVELCEEVGYGKKQLIFKLKEA